MKLFFICFNSRLSSSSMKLSSKCILSPSRSRSNGEPSQISLSSSFSRRLRSNGSIRNGQASPMFPTVSKKKGCAFENPEPSSPKVTCIGQVRVKTRKQGKKMRTRSNRRKEASFRKTDEGFHGVANPDLSGQGFQYQNLQQACLPHRNQRWVHLPLTICEALRGFGAEFNSCFFPCWSPCTSSEREKEEKAGGGGDRSGGGDGREASGGAALAEWLVALHEGEEDRTDRLEGSQRKHVLEDIDVDVEEEKKTEFVGEEEEEKARVSICIPPKNALLLMRCRSDPVKMAALANRFWESPVQKDEDEEDDSEEVEEDGEVRRFVEIPTEADGEAKPVVKGSAIESGKIPELYEVPEVNQQKQEVEDEENAGVNADQQDETLIVVSSPEAQVDREKLEIEEVQASMLQEGEEKRKEKENDEGDHAEQRSSELASSPAVLTKTSANATDEKEKETTERIREEEGTATEDRPNSDDMKRLEHKVGLNPESKERESQSKPNRGSSVLPECLLLMMCEPKLSMEVSRETWVCSTDFIRWLPERPVKKKDGGDEPKKRISIDSKPPPPPQRSPCSLPAPAAGMSVASMMIEHKLVGPKSNTCESFVLTRCKSEPMRSAAAIMAPEACFWKNRTLQQHSPAASLGIGTAGVGF